MDINFSSYGLGATVDIGVPDGIPTTVGNVSLAFNSIDRLYAPDVMRELSFITDPTTRGWLTGRRPTFGQIYPRGLYNN